jgi:flagellar basal body-associated protein FliL
MKEPASSFAQLTAIIMILIALAIGTAAMSQWMSSSPNQEETTTSEQNVGPMFASGQTP